MKALLLWWDEQHWPLAREALREAERVDLIGKGAHCLVPPEYAARALRGGAPGRVLPQARRRRGPLGPPRGSNRQS